MANERVERRQAAVLAADVVGYSRLMGADEVGTLSALKRHRRQVVDLGIAAHNGRIVKTTGDGLLVEFASAIDAVTCAMAVQEEMAKRVAEETGPPIQFRVGIKVGDIIVDVDDIYGDGVNIAARLESECEPGKVYLSDDAYRQVRGKTAFAFDDLGERWLKNIDRPVHIYAVRSAAASALERIKSSDKDGQSLVLPDKPSIAVLPFQNMSAELEQEYIADGIVEDITTALSHFKALFVIARDSSFVYKGRAVDVKQVGRELGVRYVLEGSVRKAANRLRITGQLIDAATGSHLWADRFDGDVADIFELQDQVTERVVGAIAPAIEKAEIDRAKRKPTESLDAYSVYLRGLAKFYEFSRHANEEALRLFKSAIDIDPDFGVAHGRVALCHVSAKAFGWSLEPSEEVVEVKRFSQRAVVLGKDDAMALSLSGWALAYGAGDLRSGSTLIDRALVMNSNLADCWHYGGWIKNWLGEREVALDRFAHAIRLSPLDPPTAIAKSGIAHCYFYLGRYDEAMSWAALAFQDGANNQAVLRIKAASNAFAGRKEEAREAVALLRQVNPTLRISNLREVLGPYREEDLSRYQEAMRRAGLPE